MSNIWNLFNDYEDKYQNWLKKSAVPNISDWYGKSGIDERLLQAQKGLLGTESRTMHPEGMVVTGDRHGGIFGQGGSASRALDTAGGAVQDYFQGEKVWTPDAPTELSRTGVHSSKSMEHLGKGLDFAKKGIDTAVEKGGDWLDGALEAMFPGKDDIDVTENEKMTLKEMMKSGKVDHGFINHLKNKNAGANEKDIGTLEKFTGVSKEEAMKNWKDKHGFEGLMSNPAFTLGLALMQSSAQGKSIGEDVMNNFIKAAGISEHYKDRIKAKGSIIGPPSDAEIGQVEALLKSKKMGAPGWGAEIKDFFTGADSDAEYRSMISKIASKNKKRAAALEAKGKKVEMNEDFMLETIRKMKQDGELKWKKKGHSKGFLSGWNFFRSQIGLTGDGGLFKAEGGPVEAGKPYIVGEKGPEVVVPNADATVVSNDDSQIMSMLLSSNPQLQNVSRTRAESILRSRFPDYFA